MQDLKIKLIYDNIRKIVSLEDENGITLNYAQWSKLKGLIDGFYLGKFPDRADLKNKTGYVYLLKDDNDNYKIGLTKNLESRMKSFTSLPYKIELIHYFESNNMSSDERKLHNKFSDKRISGEWFKLSTEDVEYIKNIESEY